MSNVGTPLNLKVSLLGVALKNNCQEWYNLSGRQLSCFNSLKMNDDIHPAILLIEKFPKKIMKQMQKKIHIKLYLTYIPYKINCGIILVEQTKIDSLPK